MHHEQLAEPLTEPLANRLDYIRSYKPEHERDTRLRLIDPVKGEPPEPLIKAWAAYVKAGAASNKAGAAYNKACAAYVKAGAASAKARAAYNKAGAASAKARAASTSDLEALHAIEHPDCPWNGRTIFP
ncbi:MAG: hypothetical protein IT345_10785 [Trueperaceae bacterium]|nr:hypothetical protein [Trueperaceae bacterium]